MLLVEEDDIHPILATASGPYLEAWWAFIGVMRRAGVDPEWALGVPERLDGLGLVDVGAELRGQFFRGGSPAAEFWSLTWLQMRDRIVATGTPGDVVDAGRAALADGCRWLIGPATVAAWGRRAAALQHHVRHDRYQDGDRGGDRGRGDRPRYDLTSELMGHVTLTEMFFLLLMGRAPDERERRMTDACLVAIAEHGLVPSVVAARMTLAAAPEALQGAVAAGLLGCGSVVLGSAEWRGRCCATRRAAAPSVALARERRESKAIPGFGHPQHAGGDPRANLLLELPPTSAASRASTWR